MFKFEFFAFCFFTIFIIVSVEQYSDHFNTYSANTAVFKEYIFIKKIDKGSYVLPSKNTSPNELAIILSNGDFFTVTPVNQTPKELFNSFHESLRARVDKVIPWVNFSKEDGEKYNLVSPKMGFSPTFITRLQRMPTGHNPFT